MTDKDIIKALERCKNYEDCNECPYIKCLTDKGCLGGLLTDTLNLINRRQVQIKELEERLNNIKAEAVKEFAERLKDMSEHFGEEKENFVSEEHIDNLAKEMIGE